MSDLSSEAKLRVLIVDDHAVIRRGLEVLLTGDSGVEVVGMAETGEEAVDVARRLEPDVILMDVSMPGMGGIAASRSIKEELSNVRIVGLSMHDMDGVREAMLQGGADVYLTKDSEPGEILRAMRGE